MSAKININNAKIRRKYENILGEIKGFSPRTVRIKMDDVGRFDEFLNGKDFRRLNEVIAVKYKNYLYDLKINGKSLKLKTIQGKIFSINEFYKWLRKQPGYKIKVNEDAISCLNLSKKELNSIATQVNLKESPNLEQIQELVNSIKGDTEVDKRDRALISLTASTGIRVKSLTMLRLKDFDRNRLILTLNPLDGVETKFGEAMNPVIVPLDVSLLDQFISWFDYLKNTKCWTLESPLFPQTDVDQPEGSISFSAKNVKNDFWTSTGAINKIFKDRSLAAGLPYFTPHSYRHALVQILISLNPPLEELFALARNLGHKSLLTTILHYGQIDANRRSTLFSKENMQKLIDRASERKNDSFERQTENNLKKILKELSELKKNKS